MPVPTNFKEDAGKYTTRQLAEMYDVPESLVRELRMQGGLDGPRPDVRTFTIPTLRLPSFIATSDWHIPYHDDVMVETLLDMAARHGVADLLIVGDFIDFPTLSRFDMRDIDSTVGVELSAAGDILYTLIKAGLTVHWTRGNHELRLFRALHHQVTARDLVKMTVGDTVQVHAYEGEDIFVQCGEERWFLTHPQTYNSVPLTVARKIYQKVTCNVATAHNHQYAFSYAPDGHHKLVELGGLFDPSKLAYLWRGGMSTLPMQQRGFWIVKEGRLVSTL